MNINYKMTTIILSIVLLLILVVAVSGRMMFPGDKYSRLQMHGNTGMHMMADGKMMSNSDSDAMDSMMMDMTARMQGKTGDELDKIFLADMIVHHQGAVDMAKLLQKGTKRPELQKMANDIITAQTKEITMMQTWLKEWFDGVK